MMTRANGMKKERSMAAVFLLFAFSFGSYEMGFPLGRLAFLFCNRKAFFMERHFKGRNDSSVLRLVTKLK